MQIFHGSENIIKTPQFGFGNPRNDYGLGFYCTKSVELAKEWACQKNKDGFANCYELKTEGLSILDLSSSSFSILHWLSILMQNRVFSPKSPLGKQNLDFLTSHYNLPYSEYDIIMGYRANDSYFSFASDFLENIIPIQSLATSMKLGSLGLQVVLKSEKAFESISFIKAEKAEQKIYFPKYIARDTSARKSYLENLRNQKAESSTYLVDIVRNPELLHGLYL
ncbi:MAG: DUF3990 domain-containing protein [Treponemataceae bacterium]|nr:DUF3990 domain-containing protein [Treponemataceae bacterium]